MSSIKSSIPFTPAYPPVAKGHIDSDQSRPNPLDKTAGGDAEVSNGKGGWKNAGAEYRAHANRNRIDQPPQPSTKKTVDDSQVNAPLYRPDHTPLPSDKKNLDDSPVNANHGPIDVEI